MVKDEQTQNDFGHKEKADDGKVVGKYYVLLPDGRKQVRFDFYFEILFWFNLFFQIVEYEADEKGYRPVISYEDTNQGYGRGPANGGYPSGGPY